MTLSSNKNGIDGYARNEPETPLSAGGQINLGGGNSYIYFYTYSLDVALNTSHPRKTLILALALLGLATEASATEYRYHVARLGMKVAAASSETAPVGTPGTPTNPAPAPAPVWSVTTTNRNVSFNGVNVGTYSTPDAVIGVKNTGTVSGSLSLPSVTGSNAADFTAASDCASVAVNASCSVTIRFRPSAGGARVASLQVDAGAALSLTGTGITSSDPYFANVGLLLPLDGADGATSFVDVKGNSLSRTGAAALSTAQAKFGGSSLALLTSDSKLVLGSTANTAFGTRDFTIEGWFYFVSGAPSAYRPVYTNYTAWNGGGSMYIGGHAVYGGNMSFLSNGAFDIHEASAIPLNTWVHYAFVRKGTTVAIYRNGVKTVSGAIGAATATTQATNPGFIGGAGDSSGSLWGYMDDFRITNGVARYSVDFSAPTTPSPTQ
jgi:hypothetical protein